MCFARLDVLSGCRDSVIVALSTMSQEALRNLMKECETNSELRDKVRTAADFDAFVKVASESGFEVSASDWVENQANMAIELSDDDLEQAAGGFNAHIIKTIAETIKGGTENIVVSGPSKSGTWGSFAHWSC